MPYLFFKLGLMLTDPVCVKLTRALWPKLNEITSSAFSWIVTYLRKCDAAEICELHSSGSHWTSDMAMNPNNVECFNIFTLRPLVILIPLGHSKVIWYTSFFLFFFIHFSLIYTIKIIMLMRGVLARTAFIARVILERITLNYFSLYAQLFPQSCWV